MMDWRQWLYTTLTGDTNVSALFGERVYSVAPNETPATKPFLIIRLADTIPDVGSFQDAVLWVHDEPLGYTGIDAAIMAIRLLLEGPVPVEEAILCQWQGNSPDLSDDARGTFVRTTSYRLVGGR